MVTILGAHSRQPRYVLYPKGVDHIHFAVAWDSGRSKQLNEALPRIVAALSQGLNVGLHCLQSLHRGPMGLCAVGRSLFLHLGSRGTVHLNYIGTKREIYGPYCN